MASEDKKYSLISVDTGSAEEGAGVHTRREVIDGEETIVVSSGTPSGGTLDVAADPVRLARSNLENAQPDADPAVFGEPDQPFQDDADDEDQVPFQRMQGIIIVCLIVLIVAFLVYFNFIR